MESSRELTEEQLRKLLATALRHRDYFRRLWERCRAHGLTYDDPLARRTCETWNALDRHCGALEELIHQLPRPYRPGVDPWRTSGLAAHRHVWAPLQDEARRRIEEHNRNAPPDPTA